MTTTVQPRARRFEITCHRTHCLNIFSYKILLISIQLNIHQTGPMHAPWVLICLDILKFGWFTLWNRGDFLWLFISLKKYDMFFPGKISAWKDLNLDELHWKILVHKPPILLSESEKLCGQQPPWSQHSIAKLSRRRDRTFKRSCLKRSGDRKLTSASSFTSPQSSNVASTTRISSLVSLGTKNVTYTP